MYGLMCRDMWSVLCGCVCRFRHLCRVRWKKREKAVVRYFQTLCVWVYVCTFVPVYLCTFVPKLQDALINYLINLPTYVLRSTTVLVLSLIVGNR